MNNQNANGSGDRPDMRRNIRWLVQDHIPWNFPNAPEKDPPPNRPWCFPQRRQPDSIIKTIKELWNEIRI